MRLNRLNRCSRLHESEYTVRPKTIDELVEIIKATMSEEGNKCDLNFIDVSRIKDMRGLFSRDYRLGSFNGDISEWDVSNVKVMFEMFQGSNFNGDISKWNVSNVKDMSCMFRISDFNQDISDWDVSSVEDMSWMFSKSNFNSDISKWDVSNVEYMLGMFLESAFNQDISDWDISNVKDKGDMFKDAKIKDEYKPQLKRNESRY